MAHPDLDKLLTALLPYARDQIERRGAFLPFGASMSHDGTVAVAPAPDDSAQLTASEVVSLLEARFRKQANDDLISAAGICLDVRAAPPSGDVTEAISCRLWHHSGDSVDVFCPYRNRVMGTPEYGELWAAAGTLLFD